MHKTNVSKSTKQMTELPPQGLSTWFEVFNEVGDWKWFPTVELAKEEARAWRSKGKTARIQTPSWDWKKDKHSYTEICKAVTHQQEIESGTEFIENQDGIFYDFADHMHKFYLTAEMVDKYSLHGVANELDEDELEGIKEEFEDQSVGYTHELLIDDVASYRRDKDDFESTTMTPWGEVWSETFQAYFNNFPVELFHESEDNAYYTQV